MSLSHSPASPVLIVLASCLFLHRWVHTICCLYVPGVEYVEPQMLSGVNLDQIPSSRWGLKVRAAACHCSYNSVLSPLCFNCSLSLPPSFSPLPSLLSCTLLFYFLSSPLLPQSCQLCTDEWLSRTGVCIGCDAGLCKAYFHATW